jgi:hypothetical protein
MVGQCYSIRLHMVDVILYDSVCMKWKRQFVQYVNNT